MFCTNTGSLTNATHLAPCGDAGSISSVCLQQNPIPTLYDIISFIEGFLCSLLNDRRKVKSVMPSTSGKQSAKKRSRDESEDASSTVLSPPPKDTKRRNTSKTPVKGKEASIVSKETQVSTTAVKQTVVSVSSDKPASLQGAEQTSKETLIPPLPNAARGNAGKSSKSNEKAPKNTEPLVQTQGGDINVNYEQGGDSENAMEEARCLKLLIALLAFMVLLFVGLAMFVYASSYLAIARLSTDLSNCQALQSKDLEQAGVYIRELEARIQGLERK